MNLNQFVPGKGEEIVEPKKKLTPRTRARQVAMQALYQWQLTGLDIPEITKQFSTEGRFEQMDMALYNDLVRCVSTNTEALDAVLTPLLDRSVSMIDPVEKNIMRMGIYEIQHNDSVPFQVIINEAVELAKLFGAEGGHKFVNGVLEKVAKDCRADEVSKRQSKSK